MNKMQRSTAQTEESVYMTLIIWAIHKSDILGRVPKETHRRIKAIGSPIRCLTDALWEVKDICE